MNEMIPIQNRMPASIEYIGSKKMLTGFISNTILQSIGSTPKVIADVFSGTGVVSATLKAQGYKVHANDYLEFCANISASILLNDRPPTFDGLQLNTRDIGVTRYSNIIEYLNDLPPKPGGFIHVNYSPASIDHLGFERRYFTEHNAVKIDTIRSKISEWKPELTAAEYSLLISNLISAVSEVSNVAGTYGCYLKKWKNRSLKPIHLIPSTFVLSKVKGHIVTSMDAEKALKKHNSPIVYADPPYTKRQYAAYYHVLETIVLNDFPKLTGSTGLRDWTIKASDFCYKRKAEGALESLVRSAKCEHFFLSYNSDGQISHSNILDILSSFGEAKFHEIEMKRYKSSSRPHKGPIVAERLYHLKTS